MVVRGIVKFQSTPSIVATGVTAGPLERKSAFAQQFDQIYEDERSEVKTNEQGNAKMVEDACRIGLSKLNIQPEETDFLIIGDLVNQMTPSNFAASALKIPYIGMFAACATSVSTLITAALLTDIGMSKCSIAGSSSQHNSIERQFRYPVEYGAQKPETAQWTVTAAGAAVVTPYKKGFPAIVGATIGRVIDFGITDPFNMGAAMAPAASDTLQRHLEGHGRKTSDYDAIVTGDLGKTGFEIYKKLGKLAQVHVWNNFRDAGAEFYGDDPVFLSGASGSGCSASVYFTDVFSKMISGEYNRVLLIATGALLSPLSFQQGETIPCIAHAVELIMK